ncbi:MAG: hypothetical protein WA949_13935 [Phormidesmis sp.]
MATLTFMGQSAFETQKAEALAALSARSGADVKGVVSFHGIYDPPPMAGAEEISAADKANGMFVPRAAERGWQAMRDFLAEKL